MLTVRDVITLQTHVVPPTGAVIGREGGGADIVIQDARISKRHARVYAADGGWWLEDLQSANGTYVEQQRVAAPVALGVGTNFRLAAHDFDVTEITEDVPPVDTRREKGAFSEAATQGAIEIPGPVALGIETDDDRSGSQGQEGPPDFDQADERSAQSFAGTSLRTVRPAFIVVGGTLGVVLAFGLFKLAHGAGAERRPLAAAASSTISPAAESPGPTVATAGSSLSGPGGASAVAKADVGAPTRSDDKTTELAKRVPPDVKPEPHPAVATPVEAAALPKLSAYQRYAQKRDAIERAITDDPLVLRRDANVARGYKGFRAAVAKAHKTEVLKVPGDETLIRHLVDADVFATQSRVIDDLYSRLHLPPL